MTDKERQTGYQRRIGELQVELESTAKLVQSERSSLDSMKSEIEKLRLEESKLISSISSKKEQEKALELSLTGKKRLVDTLLKQQDTIESKFLVRIKDLQQKIKELEKELNGKEVSKADIKKNEKILTEIEYQKMKLQSYVRILQNYYDETHINLNILPEFGLTNK